MLNVKQRLMDIVAPFGQSHLLRFWDQLDDSQQRSLASQIESIDFGELGRAATSHSSVSQGATLASQAEPPHAIAMGCDSVGEAEARQMGQESIRAGKLAMILVAGGQGTRLGFSKPKGLFRIGPLSDRTLFAMHVDSLRGAMKKYGVEIPLFIMTSPATDQETRDYFQSHDNLGLPSHLLRIFQQGVMPAVDSESGKILLEETYKVALSPDGHGGVVSALSKQGILDHCRSLGIEHFFYAQVDNPLVLACDPSLIGHHLRSRSQMTTQVVRKRFAKEKVGNVVSVNGRTQIIEYSDLPDEAAERRNPDGSLTLWAGNIAVHVIDRSFLETCSTEAGALPFHLARKVVPYVNESGDVVKPSQPNAIKFERFVFDLLPKADRAIVVEGDAAEVFAPVKNADGAPTDTPSACRAAISNRFKNWLKAAGVEVSHKVAVEINPLWAFDVEDLKSKFSSSVTITVDTYFA